MSATTIEYRYVENNTRSEKRGTCTTLSQDGAVAISVEFLGATKLASGDYIYFAQETGEHWVATAEELAVLGAARHCRSGSDHYSLWCQDSGRRATDSEVAEIDG